MKKFLKKIVCLISIVALTTIVINECYVRMYGANPNYTDKFSEIPEQIQICNFGSSHGLFGYNWEDYEQSYNCFNFALEGQFLSYDYRIFENYKEHIQEGTVVFITISYFSLFGKSENYEHNFESKNKRYYTILPNSLIKEYDLKTDIFVRYLPALGTDTSNLVRTLLGKEREDKNDMEWNITANGTDVAEDANRAYYRHIIRNKFDENGKRIKNTEEIEALYNLVEECKKRGAIPILITTPYTKEYTEKVASDSDNFYDDFYSLINKISEDTGVEYYDYAFDKRFSSNYSWFMDSDHLNKEGARNFVDIIMNEVVFKNGYY